MVNKRLKILAGIEILIIVILISGCIFYDQKTEIHDTAIAKEIVYYPNTQIPMHPIAGDTFKTDVEVIYACANVTSTPFESDLYIRWNNVYEYHKVVEDSNVIECSIEGCWHCFNITKPKEGWKIGNYSVDFHLAGNKDVFSHTEFRIVEEAVEKQNQVCIKDNCFYVELAITPNEWARGLMFREHLDLDKGMLFIFEEEREYPFWMKNTSIPLDIIWINKNKEVVFISKNAQPCKSDICPTINPGKKAAYALELNGGISDKIGLAVGDNISIEFFNLK